MREPLLNFSLTLWLGLAVLTAQGQDLPTELFAKVQAGKALVVSREAQCTLCHRIPEHAGAMGDLGPNLEGVASRLSPEAMALRVKDSRRINPYTIMPPYFSTEGLSQVDPKFKNQTILSETQLQQVLSYLGSLK
jgi:sulfur-oxidizing protein SoxX